MSTQVEPRVKLLKKLINSVMKDGFQHLRMDDIAKHMDVSRATMYKYFSSKEEVIAGVVQVFVDYIERLADRNPEDDERSFGIWFQKLFDQTVALVGKITDIFLKDLQTIYPELYDQLRAVLSRREQQALIFYREGKEKGIFNPINERLILLQDDLLLREIINVKYLLQNQISIEQVLYDYYNLKKIQLFKADKIHIVDDSLIEPIIQHVVDKFNRALSC
ncbi:TetR family transcriptional regulator [Bacillus sp. FJAT-27264]|uniref:TetR/AcrR family transcriptional regulator n=1 Tax=Paenibacillus sp. (strain DSM 101736 / FJAT-27264) TaxID=1850362 RepID=UPI000807E0E4|nr:TetR/AcrR family transcriptional regulator [Bacillus sp. FJAT-27264]OBZ18458.1 TetR family transcriptional regulator [Bacillus sp. FJAT-27264]